MKTKETLEEAAERLSELQEATYTTQHKVTYKHGFIDGAKFQAERMYSEEDLDTFRKFMIQEQNFSKSCLDVFIKQFKKK